MRSIIHPLSLAVLLSVIPGLAAQKDKGEKPPSPAKKLLQDKKVPTDGKALLAFLQKRTGADADWQKRKQLIQDLGNEKIGPRELAAKKLVALGPGVFPDLRHALQHKDSEIVARAKECMAKIEKNWDWAINLAVVRVLLEEPPKGIVETLLDFLPYAGDPNLEEEIWFGLYNLAKKDRSLLPLLEKRLADPLPPRRALAGCVLAAMGNAEQRKLVLPLLKDTDPTVRLRAAQGLLSSGEPASLPVLIELLDQPSVDISWSAEELLHWVALDNAPEPKVGAATPKERQQALQAWQQWWQKNEKSLDLSKRWEHYARPGLVLLCGYEEKNTKEAAQYFIWLCGSDARPRWKLKIPLYHQAQLLPNNKLLVSGNPTLSSLIRELDLQGKSHWGPEIAVTFPDPLGKMFTLKVNLPARNCQRLPNGNTFLPLGNQALEISPDAKQVWYFPGFPARDFTNCGRLLDTGKLLYFARMYKGGKNQQLVLIELDRNTKKEVQRITVQKVFDHIGEVFLRRMSNGKFLVSFLGTGWMGEIDQKGKVVWEIGYSSIHDPIKLPNGNILFSAGGILLECDPQGNVLWEMALANASFQATDCLPLVRLGFETPRPEGWNLKTNVPYILKGLKGKDTFKRYSTLYGLKKLQSKVPPELIPHLIESLDTPDSQVRGDLITILSNIGNLAFPFFVKATRDKRDLVRAQAIQTLCTLTFSVNTEEVIKICRLGIEDKSSLVRAQAIVGFCNLNKKTDESLKVCLAGIDDESPLVRSYSWSSLSYLFYRRNLAALPLPPKAIDPTLPKGMFPWNYYPEPRLLTQKEINQILSKLIKALDDPGTTDDSGHHPVSSLALSTLKRFGPKGKSAVPALIEKLKSKDFPNRILVFRVLGEMGPEAKAAIPELIRIAQAKEPQINGTSPRGMAIWVLGKIGPGAKEAIPVITQALKDEEESIRKVAEEALSKIQKGNK